MSRRKPELGILQSSALIKFEEGFKKYTPPKVTITDKNVSNEQLAELFKMSPELIQKYVVKGVDKNYYNPKVRPKMLELYNLMKQLEKQEGNDKGTISTFRNKINENTKSCPEGMINRMQQCIESASDETTVPAILGRIRKDIAQKVANKLKITYTHSHEVVRVVLNGMEANIPIPEGTVDDHYAKNIIEQDRETVNSIIRTGAQLFKEHYTPHAIAEELLESAFLARGCKDYLQADDSPYNGVAVNGAYLYYQKILNLNDESDKRPIEQRQYDVFIMGEDDDGDERIYAVKKSRVISDTITHCFKEGIFDLSQLSKASSKEYNGTTLKFHIDEGNIKNTLIQFKRKDGETTQFFLGNAHHFSLDTENVLDTSYMLGKEDKKALIYLIDSIEASPGVKEELKVKLVASGFDITLNQNNQFEVDALSQELGDISGLEKRLEKLPEKQQKRALLKNDIVLTHLIRKADDLLKLKDLASKDETLASTVDSLSEERILNLTVKSLESTLSPAIFKVAALYEEKYPQIEEQLKKALIKKHRENWKDPDTGSTAAMLAIKAGYNDVALRIINTYKDSTGWGGTTQLDGLSSENENEETALSIAANMGNETICKAILKKKINHYNSKQPLKLAAQGGHTKICQMIFDKASNFNRDTRPVGDAIIASATNGHTSTCEMLVKCCHRNRFPASHVFKALSKALENKHDETSTFLSNVIKKSSGIKEQLDGFLKEATKNSNINMYLALAKINPVYLKENARNIISIAANDGHTNIVSELVIQGALEFDAFSKLPSKVISRETKLKIVDDFSKLTNITDWVEKTAARYLGTRQDEAKATGKGAGLISEKGEGSHRLTSLFGIPYSEKKAAVKAFVAFTKNPSPEGLADLKKNHWRGLNEGRTREQLFKPFLMHQRRNDAFKKQIGETSANAWLRTQEKKLGKPAPVEQTTQKGSREPLKNETDKNNQRESDQKTFGM